MKICWDNLENIRITKNGNFKLFLKDGEKRCIYYLVCKKCKEPFLGFRRSAEFCTHTCRARYPMSNITKNKLSKASTGRKHTKETKQRLKYLAEKRYAIGEIQKKISKTMSGKNNPMYGKSCPEETRLKISKATKGKKRTEETRKRMSKNHADFSGKNSHFYGKHLYGKDNPNWKGGKSYEPYCQIFSDKDFKQMLRERDHNICWTCGKSQKQNKRRLDVHHIDHNKQNCHPSNFITLCHSCHGTIQGDREWYEEWYKRAMSKRFGYEY